MYAYVVYWVMYFVLFWLIESAFNQDYYHVFLANSVGLPLKIIFVTIVLELLMERFLFRDKLLLFILFFLPLLLLFAFLQRVVDNEVIIDYILKDWEKQPLVASPAYVYNLIKYSFVTAIPFTARLFAQWTAEQKRVQAIEAEKLQAELDFLRNQFHPHFIFNVLNSLYSKILSGSPDAAGIVLKVSSLLRFTTYDINTPTIPLEKEIGYLKDFIALQRTRFGNNLDISFSTDGPVENGTIEPFLIIPFIENSFKHCISGESSTGWITIHIAVAGDWLTVKVENSVAGTGTGDKQPAPGTDNNRGVGLLNVRKRLALLYPGTHTLKINEDADSFFVLLKIKLHSHAG